MINLGEAPGTFTIEGNYSQDAAGTLNLNLREGGAVVNVTGDANFDPGATVNLTRLPSARFGDAFTLTAATASAFLITVSDLPSNGLQLHIPVTGALQFTTITTSTAITHPTPA